MTADGDAAGTATPSVLIPEGAAFSCGQCGDCCRGDWLIPLTRDEVDRLKRLVPDVEPSVESESIDGRETPVMARRLDGACVYLEKNVCRIHRDFGEEAKPATCRIFPFSFRRFDDAVHVHLSRICPAVRRETGATGDALREAAGRSLRVATPKTRILPSALSLAGRLTISPAEYRELEDRLVRLIGDDRWALDDALAAGDRLIQERAGNARPIAGASPDPAIELVLDAIASRKVMPGLHRYLIATAVTTIESGRGGRGRALATRVHDLRRLLSLIIGKGVVPLGGVAGPVDLLRLRGIPWPRRHHPDLGPLRRFIQSHLRQGILLLAPDIEYGYHLLLGAYALIKFYARASAVAAGRERLHAEDLWSGLTQVEKNLLTHRPLRGKPLEKRLVRGWFRRFLFHPAYADSMIAG